MEWSDTEIDRYSRHLLLEEVGWEGGERIREGALLIVGDVGATAVRYLAAAGVARLSLARAPGGLVEVARRANPAVVVERLPEAALTAEAVARHHALAVGPRAGDAVAQAWAAAHRPAVVTATTPSEVMVTTLLGGGGCPACVDLPAAPPPAGPLAPAMEGIAGAVVATELLKLLAEVSPPLAGELLAVDTAGSVQRRPVGRRTPCPACD